MRLLLGGLLLWGLGCTQDEAREPAIEPVPLRPAKLPAPPVAAPVPDAGAVDIRAQRLATHADDPGFERKLPRHHEQIIQVIRTPDGGTSQVPR